MGQKQKETKKEGKPQAEPKKSTLKRKACKSPRGTKGEKVKANLLDAVVYDSARRTRNDYNHRMAQVKKLARLLS